MSKRRCTNTACSMRDQSVTTERSTCMACGRPLSNQNSDLFDSVFGGLFGESNKESAVPDEVVVALREAEVILLSFINKTAVKRSALEAAHVKVTAVLRRFG